MELKDYQIRCLDRVKTYMQYLYELKIKNEKLIKIDKEYGINVPEKAWIKLDIRKTNGDKVVYKSKKTGISEDVPSFCLKVPTGGGKTLIATKTIDLINTYYQKKKTGLVIWIVPTTQIYRQTIDGLRNREHPYRQTLDISSGGKTLILQKGDRFNKQDVDENLVILMLMLPSANRKNKETLKIFQDSGGFDSFFPLEDFEREHIELIKKYPNLDYYGIENSLNNIQVKTSLGNTLRILNPIIIIDEGHKAYSEGAQNTIRGFNPSILVELSATPSNASNILVDITGQELNREQMIKLDIHVTNKASLNWKDTMLASVEKSKQLHNKAKEYKSNTGKYIRPICLIQVERTGKNQLNKGFIHAEDVKEYLISNCGISSEEIAIKSSEKDDIEGIDLLSEECRINYIITKQALQEGWDCSFAYILTVLTDTTSQLNITQLVGRILRQPRAKKTGIRELDECYVFCFRPNTDEVLKNIKSGLEGEGLGDIASRITCENDGTDGGISTNNISVKVRNKYKKYINKIYLPRFIIEESENKWREINYEIDILSRIDWTKLNLSDIEELTLSFSEAEDEVFDVTLSDNQKQVISKNASEHIKGGLDLDYVFVVRHIISLIPNPWIAYEVIDKTIKVLMTKYSEEIIASNLVLIIEKLNTVLSNERDRLSEEVFRNMICAGKLFFFLQTDTNFSLPEKKYVKKSARRLERAIDEPIEKSLLELVAEDDLNETEKAIAIYLDKQEKLLLWYRNIVKQDYYIQGWKKGKIYPDFICTKVSNTEYNGFSSVYVLETKGLYLDNTDTAYKKNVFELCNDLANKKSWGQIAMEFEDNRIEFKLIYDNEWKSKINEMFS